MKKLLAIIVLFSLLFVSNTNILAAENTTKSTSITAVDKISNENLEITWSKVADSDGYRIYRSTEYNGEFTMLKDLTSNKYVDKVTAGSRYYYKVNSYKIQKGKKVFTEYSTIKSAYVNAKGIPSISSADLKDINVSSNDLIVVAVNDESSTSANFTYLRKSQYGNWVTYFSTIGFVGKNGIGKTKEGDGKTPIGLFQFNTAFGVASKPEGTKISYTKVDSSYWLVSDSSSKYYNQFVSTKNVKQDWGSSFGEQLFNYTTPYKYSLVLNYNPTNIPYKGSAIFLHCYSSKQYTAGCIAIPEAKMKYLLKNIDENTTILIDTKENLKKY